MKFPLEWARPVPFSWGALGAAWLEMQELVQGEAAWAEVWVPAARAGWAAVRVAEGVAVRVLLFGKNHLCRGIGWARAVVWADVV